MATTATAAGDDAVLPASSANNDAPDLLVVILDTNPFAWHASAAGSPEDAADSLSFSQALQSVLVLCNAHLALRFENEVCVYSAGLGRSELLYSSLDATRQAQQPRSVGAVQPPQEPLSEAKESDANSYQAFRIVDERIGKRIRELQDEDTRSQEDGPGAGKMQDLPVAISPALSKALCHIHRLSASSSPNAGYRARILVISLSPEASTQYIPIMNCIFSAQKSSIPIDVCRLALSNDGSAGTGGAEEEAVFLQQASYLTKASYVHLQNRGGLLQYLLMAFLPGLAVRKHLHLPAQDQIDLRAACFCHKRIVDIGYVCSVCLSIFCAPTPACTTCRTRFPIASLKRLMGGGGAAIAAPSAAGAPGSTNGTTAPTRKRKAPPGGNSNGQGSRGGTPATPGV